MPRKSPIPNERLDEILAWLDPDREVAGAMYVQLRHDLAKIFTWKGCSDAEGLTDEVFDRVAKRISELRSTYEGDPRRYFYGVANNLVKENLKDVKTQVSLDHIDPEAKQTIESEDDTAEIEEGLQACLRELRNDKRELILAYYAKEKQAKIDHRIELARRLQISVETLRVRVCRIRRYLEECIKQYVEGKHPRE